MTKFTFDGVEITSEAEAIAAMVDLKQRCDAAQAELETAQASASALEAERDAAREQLEAARKDAADMAAGLDAKIAAGVAARQGLLLAAQKAGVEIKADQSDEDIKKSIILAVSPEAKLDGKDAVYIQARFDGAMEQLDAKQAQQNRQDAGDAGAGAQRTDSADSSRGNMIKNLTNAWQGAK